MVKQYGPTLMSFSSSPAFSGEHIIVVLLPPFSMARIAHIVRSLAPGIVSLQPLNLLLRKGERGWGQSV